MGQVLPTEDQSISSWEPVPVMPFPARSWPEAEVFYSDLVEAGAKFVKPTLAIVRSVIFEDGAAKLSGYTSMHTLVVTSTPVKEWPDVLRVELMPGSSAVKITHDKFVRAPRSGLPDAWTAQPGDSVTRGAGQAVPLFWRFCIEKFGVHPGRDTEQTDPTVRSYRDE